MQGTGVTRTIVEVDFKLSCDLLLESDETKHKGVPYGVIVNGYPVARASTLADIFRMSRFPSASDPLAVCRSEPYPLKGRGKCRLGIHGDTENPRCY